MDAPAGWHPQPDGRERFWDGNEWTDEFRPLAMSTQAPGNPGARPSRRKFNKHALGYPATAVFALLIGLGAGGSATPSTATGAPQTPASSATSTSSSPASPSESDTPTPDYTPSVKDFSVGVKILKKECFGSAGCNITFRIVPGFAGTLPSSGTVEVTYAVKGGTDPITNTFTMDSDGTAHFDSDELAQTASSSTKLTAVVTDVSFQP